MPISSLLLGVTETVRNAAATTATTSTTYAMPARLCNLAWQYFFTTNPSAVTMVIQGSLDGTNWATLDSTTITTGNLRVITAPAVNFVRVNLSAITAGALYSVLLTARDTQ